VKEGASCTIVYRGVEWRRVSLRRRCVCVASALRLRCVALTFASAVLEEKKG
jgi:hypothetical protein